MSFLRFLMLLSLIVWLGGLIFLPGDGADCVSGTAHATSGRAMVGRSLGILHWMGMSPPWSFWPVRCYSAGLATANRPRVRPAECSHLPDAGAYADFAIWHHSAYGRAQGFDRTRSMSAPVDLPARVQFDALHHWSTRMESGVLLLGLVVAYLASRSFA